MKHLPYFLLVAASLSLIPVAADASELESWRFDSTQNQLEFTTDEDVQPKAQLIADPTRLVIDLPGIVLGRPAFTEPVSGGTIRSVRIGQFDRQTTRIVIELAPGYTLDPDQVRFRGITARQWTVQLPTPQPLSAVNQPPAEPSSAPPTAPVSPRTPSSAAARGSTQLQGVRVTPDGLFVRTSGNPPEINVSRSENRRQIAIDFQGTTIAGTAQRDFLVNRYGVNRVQVTQLQASPPVVRLTLNVSETSPDWQASVSNLGGVVLVPSGGVTAATVESRPSNPSSSAANSLATISAIGLEGNGTQLVIRADQPLQFTTGWDRPTGYYRITINSAKLAPQVKGPQLDARSPISRLRLRQEDARTVAILLQPAAGVQIREVNQPSQQVLALQLQRRNAARLPSNPSATIPVPAPPRTAPSVPDLPRVPNGRRVVIVDPGHGGPDPGAVGIGGLQEKGIVLDIGQQVASLLEQQGVQAILTRSDDRDLDLEPRVRMAEQANATIFVSIHANSIDLSRPDISGLETYYYQSGAALARTIHASILQGTGIRDRGVRQARFYVLRRTSMPSVLIEVGFVTGRDDAARLSDPAYRSQMAAAIVQGILQYLRQ